MIDVALTGRYYICLFNSAAPVLSVGSGHGNPSEELCAHQGDLNFPQVYGCCSECYQQRYSWKRELKIETGH